MSLKIFLIIIENGRIGETHFAFHEETTNKILKTEALSDVLTLEVAEWYRQQYNIPIPEFEQLNIDESIIYKDFYRRHYFQEIRLGLRKWNDTSPEFKMPPFTIFRPFGGALPVPNGYKVDTFYTYDSDKSKEKSREPNSDETDKVTLNDDGTYTVVTKSSGPPSSLGSKTESYETEYQTNEDDFNTMMTRFDDDSLWEELETIQPGE